MRPNGIVLLLIEYHSRTSTACAGVLESAGTRADFVDAVAIQIAALLLVRTGRTVWNFRQTLGCNEYLCIHASGASSSIVACAISATAQTRLAGATRVTAALKWLRTRDSADLKLLAYWLTNSR